MTDNLETIKNKISQMLSKTIENGASEAEAEAAIVLAKQLMKKYSISMEDIAQKKASIEDFIEVQITQGPIHPIDRLLITPISKYTDTKGYYLRYVIDGERKGGGIHFFGYKVDVELATFIYKICRIASDDLWDKYKVQLPVGQRANVRVAYLLGIADRLADRILELLEKDIKSTGTDLIVVKNMLVEAAFNNKDNKKVETNNSLIIKDFQEEAFFAGYKDGDTINFHRELNTKEETKEIGV